MAKLSRAELEADLADTKKREGLWMLSTIDLLAGAVTWFGRGKIRIGLCREAAACGGYVLIRQDGNTCVAYLDDAVRNYRERLRLDNEEDFKICSLLEECTAQRRRAYAAGAA